MEPNPTSANFQPVRLGNVAAELGFGIGVLVALFGILHLTGIRKIIELRFLVNDIALPLFKFARDSVRLFKRCTKPTRKEYTKICLATAIGFGLMGSIGFMVKLVHIPINNILVS